MKEITGTYATAKIFTDALEEYAADQIRNLCDNEASQGCKIRIMPDVHPGKVGTIGTTMTISKKVIPNITGADIGCGVTCAVLKEKRLEGKQLDAVIRNRVPAGSSLRKEMHRFCLETDLSGLCCLRHIQEEKDWHSLGTLGGGNHFIEVDRDEDGRLYLLIHSGSRHLGTEVCSYYQNLAYREAKQRGIPAVQPTAALEGQSFEDYLHDVEIVQEFAAVNRACILDEIVKGMGWKVQDQFDTVHNYIDFRLEQSQQNQSQNQSFSEQPETVRGILRKGAVSAKKGERLVIPIHMKDGVLLCTGLGNPDWNESAPHGAGRRYSREEARKRFTVSAFKKEMQGIYSSCVSPDTLDEAPFAYRGKEDILQQIGETVKVEKLLQPVYNFKAPGRE